MNIEGWKALIPVYNMCMLARIAGRPLWLVGAMFFCVFVSTEIGLFAAAVIQSLIYYDVAKAFGKGPGFIVGLILLPVVFFPILAFDNSTYQSE